MDFKKEYEENLRRLNMKEKTMRFMQGRYGADDYAKFLLVISLIFILLANFTSKSFFSVVGLGLIVYAYFRILSKNPPKRWRENQSYLKKKRQVMTQINKMKHTWQQRKQYRFYKCPSCKQKVRVPKGKNKIKITCPSCSTQFIKKT
ncbi:zinc ribbon domain-containing protein [Desemzia sp. RIT804]|uniref:zinc ribbon domain-containing protein n=1 Tax=Desemzia sp. RIT 804 TaxID=2810209 RepID=UPI00195066E8|nr:zinc ribbon domain-containing protein [Desemzia sp. RIT 804]MBM6613395.1 zinc ribbon domain-containing protein [Desemzia sp. RIT 804]